MKNKLIILSIIGIMLSQGIAYDSFKENIVVEAETDNVISKEVLKDKMKGGWLGELWGNFTGLPTEFKFTVTPNPEEKVDWILGDTYVTDDDTSMEYTFLHMMEVYGANTITYQDMPKEWLYHFQDYIWEGNYYARELMKQGYIPPETGKIGINKAAEALDAQIECEIFGFVTPGMLQNCKERTTWWMAAVGDGTVLDNSAFYAMLCSNGFFENDIYKSMETVRSYFDDNSQTAYIYDSVKEIYENNKTDWRLGRKLVNDKFATSYALDNKINFAMTILSLFYGENDYEKTVQTAILAGYDNDCNAATCGAIIGIMKGYSGLPKHLVDASGTYYRNTNRPGLPSNSIDELTDRMLIQAEDIILSAGGVKNGSSYIIFDSSFSPATATNEYFKPISCIDNSFTYSNMHKFYNPNFLSAYGYGSTKKGSYVEFTFSGTEVEIVSATSLNGGSFALEIDGEKYGIIDLTSAETYCLGKFESMSYDQTIKKVRNLENKQHTVRLTSLEEGKFHSIDYINVVCTEDEYYSDTTLNIARTKAATPVTSVYAPIGTGAGGGGIGAICDGYYYKQGDHSSLQYDSFYGFTGSALIPKEHEDFIGYEFSRTFSIGKLIFNEGGHWGTDGGWFADGTMRVEALINGAWTAVEYNISPSYPNSNQLSSFGLAGETYVITVNVEAAQGIRLIGTPGGNYKLISCGELEVYGLEG